MVGQELILVLHENKAYLLDDKYIPLVNTGINVYTKKFSEPVHLKLIVKEFQNENNKIICQIISYNLGLSDFDNSQKLIATELGLIENIEFERVHIPQILKLVANEGASIVNPTEKSPIVKKDVFKVSLNKVRFKMGCVTFMQKYKGYKDFEISITNYDVREEFDSIKNYFAKVLGSKRIEVNTKLEFGYNKITCTNAQSDQIDKINQGLIEMVKIEYTKGIIKPKKLTSVDKNLFTADEFFEDFSNEKFKSNAFFNDENELFDNILQVSNTKHYKNLRFLSSKHAHSIMKLRFILDPFSFIFLIEGDRNYHLIWETLNTEEATYVWHVEKEKETLKTEVRKLEDIINTIKVQGKTAYINSSEDNYKRIYHDYSDIIDGFVKWKGELESILF